MKLLDLMRECGPSPEKTLIQRLAKCKTFTGNEIEITSKITGIIPGTIYLDLYSSDICRKYEFNFFLLFDEKKFEEQLLSFEVGDVVNCKAKLRNVELSPLWYYFDLVSIAKISSRIQMEIDEKGKAEKENNERLAKSKNNGACFIATACYGNYEAPEVLVLRQFRDEVLTHRRFGRIVINLYYLLSPSIAKLINRSEILKAFVRKQILAPIIVKIKQNL